MLEIHQEAQSEFSEAEEPLREPLSSLSVELGRISAEIQSINSGFQAQIEQAISESRAAVENEYRARFQRAMEKARKEFEAELESRDARLAELHREVKRVTSLLSEVSNEIARMIDDPAVELSLLIRKKAELGDLRSYLEGLRYGLDPASSIPGEG